MDTQQRVSTGDTTRHRLRTVAVGVDGRRLRITVDDGATAEFDADAWDEVAYKVDAGVRLDWLDPRSRFQLLHGPDLASPIRLIDSTASYQLFKAAFEVAQILRLVQEPTHALRRSEDLSGTFTRYGTRGALYFPTRELLGNASPDALKDLVAGNKLCRLQLDVAGDQDETCFVPYATPIGPTETGDQETEHLWDRIREEHRAVREGRLVW